MKEIVRSPFGQIIRDTNTGMDLSIDFAGGLIDQYTNLVHIGDRVYDPVLGQWMTPDWTRICKPGAMKNPTDVFSYRFNGNDPINRKKTATNLMSGKDWFLFFSLCSFFLSFNCENSSNQSSIRFFKGHISSKIQFRPVGTQQ